MTASDETAQPRWALTLVRMSLFPTSLLDVRDDALWPQLAGDVPLASDRLQLQPAQQRVQSGPAQNGTLQVQVYPHRIDIVLAADGATARPGAPPVIADMERGLQEAAGLALRAAGLPGHTLARLAFAIQLLEQYQSARGSLQALGRAVPGLPIRADDSEVMFQRGREASTGDGAPMVNLVEKWSAATLQMVPMPAFPPSTAEVVPTDVHVLMLDVEANTMAGTPTYKRPEEARAAMSRLIEQARGAFA